jgi:hypothetical protein
MGFLNVHCRRLYSNFFKISSIHLKIDRCNKNSLIAFTLVKFETQGICFQWFSKTLKKVNE